jgi:3-oxoacyl-[acyl-carrier-protein] synthase-3
MDTVSLLPVNAPNGYVSRPTPTRAGIFGLGHAVPPRVMTNADLEKIVETNDAWIRSRTGIEQRYILGDDQSLADLATEAAQRALLDANLTPADLDLIIVATCTPDFYFPPPPRRFNTI